MAIISTSGNKEDFIVQVNGDYNVPFDEVEITGTFKSGTILASATAAATDESTDVLGILAEDNTGTNSVRVMVRGNPTTVNAQALVNLEDGLVALLAAKGIIVVNE